MADRHACHHNEHSKYKYHFYKRISAIFVHLPDH